MISPNPYAKLHFSVADCRPKTAVHGIGIACTNSILVEEVEVMNTPLTTAKTTATSTTIICRSFLHRDSNGSAKYENVYRFH